MPDNRINNNTEVKTFMDLEALVRVYTYFQNGDPIRKKIQKLIEAKLIELDESRSYKFDTEAALKQLIKQLEG